MQDSHLAWVAAWQLRSVGKAVVGWSLFACVLLGTSMAWAGAEVSVRTPVFQWLQWSVWTALAVLALGVLMALRGVISWRKWRRGRKDVSGAGDASSASSTSHQKLVHLALHDELTHLPNKILLDDRLDQAVRWSAERQSSFAVLSLGLAGLDTIEELHSRLQSDQLLVMTAQRIEARVRRHDTLACVSSDEFVLIVEVADAANAAVMAERLLQVVRESAMVAGHEFALSSNIGIAIYPQDGDTPPELLGHAVSAMHHARTLGGNTFSFFDASANAVNTNAETSTSTRQCELLQDLRTAIDRGEMVLHYQPEFASPNGPVTGVEALIRWQHPSRGLLMPGEFIGLAESGGLMAAIGDWVLDEACRQMAQWRTGEGSATRREWTVAVNLSPAQFEHPQLLEKVRASLTRHGLEPSGLTLEVSETTLMRDVAASEAVLRQLRELGVRTAIDDFGGGHSSLANLRQLRANELKIDGNFVRSLLGDSRDQAILASIVALGRAFGLKVVAVGVETSEQQMLLAKAGCDVLQGYYLARPMPPQTLVMQ